MQNPATVQDVADRWKPLTAARATVTEAYLVDAWALLKSQVPSLEDNLEADPPQVDVEVVRGVICAAVLRVVRNINSFEQVEIDDFKPRFNDGATGVLAYTDEELGRCEPTTVPTDSFTVVPYSLEA